MVVIRLTRVGKKKQAHYRIVVADSRKAVQAKFISILGWYNPHTKELQVKQDELKAWFDKGAKPSNTLAKLLKAHKIDLPKWVKIEEKNKKSKQKEEEVKPAAPKAAEAEDSADAEVPTDNVGEEKAEEGAEAPAEESAETPAEETVEEAPAENAEPEAVEEEKSEEVAEESVEEPKEDK